MYKICIFTLDWARQFLISFQIYESMHIYYIWSTFALFWTPTHQHQLYNQENHGADPISPKNDFLIYELRQQQPLTVDTYRIIQTHLLI